MDNLVFLPNNLARQATIVPYMHLRTTKRMRSGDLTMDCNSTWGDVARGAHNSEGFALAGEDLGDAKVTNLDMIQGPYTYRIYGL